MDNRIKIIDIAQEFVIEAPRATVFESLTEDVGSWWDHSFEENPKAIRLEAQLNGKFYEEWDNKGGVMYGTISAIRLGGYLKITGPMGMSGPVLGTIEFELIDHVQGTLLKLNHKAMGLISDETAANYSKGWTQLLGHQLKSFVEQNKKSKP